jgi:hypothetical protein
MRISGAFLLLATALLIATIALVIFYEFPPEPSKVPYEEPPRMCGLDRECLAAAMTANCQKAAFELQSPFTAQGRLDGEIAGRAVGKCDVIITDPLSGDSMECYLKEPVTGISYAALAPSCSGILLDRLRAAL